MTILYQIGIFLYFLGAAIISPFNKKASLFIKGRYRLLDRIKDEVISDKPVVWFHCASIGEFEQARPLIEKCKKSGKDEKILVTFFSPSGYELRKNYKYADWVYYLPVDSFRNARKFINAVNPKAVFFIKYEYWYFFLSVLHSQSIPCYLVSSIFRPKQLFFKWYGSFFRRILSFYELIFVQDEISKNLLNKIGVENVVVSGDTRFDRVKKVADENAVKDNETVKRFSQDFITLIAGSTWEKDELLLCKTLKSFPRLKMVLVPHEVNKERIGSILRCFSDYKIVLFSQCGDFRLLREAQILVIDCMGLLSSLYKYGKYAYIGGGFGVGIHNILEAAAYGSPVFFGPNYHQFKEACDLIDLGGAFSVSSSKGLTSLLTNLISSDTAEEVYSKISEISKDYVESHIGATDMILGYLIAV